MVIVIVEIIVASHYRSIRAARSFQSLSGFVTVRRITCIIESRRRIASRPFHPVPRLLVLFFGSAIERAWIAELLPVIIKLLVIHCYCLKGLMYEEE